MGKLPKKVFPAAIDTAPYSQKRSNFHWCFPMGFTPETVCWRRRIVCSLSRVSLLPQKVSLLYFFTRGKAWSSKIFICWCKLFLNPLVAVDFWEILRDLEIFNLLLVLFHQKGRYGTVFLVHCTNLNLLPLAFGRVNSDRMVLTSHRTKRSIGKKLNRFCNLICCQIDCLASFAVVDLLLGRLLPELSWFSALRFQ